MLMYISIDRPTVGYTTSYIYSKQSSVDWLVFVTCLAVLHLVGPHMVRGVGRVRVCSIRPVSTDTGSGASCVLHEQAGGPGSRVSLGQI